MHDETVLFRDRISFCLQTAKSSLLKQFSWRTCLRAHASSWHTSDKPRDSDRQTTVARYIQYTVVQDMNVPIGNGIY